MDDETKRAVDALAITISELAKATKEELGKLWEANKLLNEQLSELYNRVNKTEKK